MRLLLDSNVLYWSFTQNRLLTPRVFGLLSDRSNELFVSSVSLWELSIKVARGKLVVPNGTILSFYEQIDRIASLSLLSLKLTSSAPKRCLIITATRSTA